MAPSAQFSFTASDGARIEGVVQGEGVAVVCVHGWGASRLSFTELRLPGCAVVTYDQRGHGASGRGGELRVRRLAQDLSELMRHLDLRDVTLV